MRSTAAALMGAALLAAGCGADDAPEQSGSPASGRDAQPVEQLRMSGGPWGYPSPFAYVRGPGLVHAGFVFDTLLSKDSSGEMLGWLAEEWKRSEDGRQWTFTLRDGVKWHDGRPLTAKDVAFTFDDITKGPGSRAPGLAGRVQVDEVIAEDDRTVVFRLPAPLAPFEETVAGRVPIIPEHVWSKVDDPEKFRGRQAVMSTGPYHLKEHDPGAKSYLYEANEDYFLGTPVVRRMEFVPAKDELLALRRGELDIASAGLEDALPEQALAPFEDEPFDRIEAPGEWNRALHFNLAKGFPYDDKRFRQAVAYAVDRKDLVDRVLLGRGDVGSMGGLAPSNEWTAEGLPTYDHDTGKAEQLLDEAGLTDARRRRRRRRRRRPRPTRRQGVRARASDELLPGAQDRGARSQLPARGGPGRPRAQPRPSGRRRGDRRGRLRHGPRRLGGLGGEPDTLRFRLSSQTGPPAGKAGAGGKDASKKGKGGGGQGSFNRVHGYRNPRFDRIAAQQLTAVDEDKRAELLDEMQQIVAEDVPLISLYVPKRLEIFRANVFDAWYFTPGGVWGGYPGALNKHAFVTGQKTGLPQAQG